LPYRKNRAKFANASDDLRLSPDYSRTRANLSFARHCFTRCISRPQSP